MLDQRPQLFERACQPERKGDGMRPDALQEFIRSRARVWVWLLRAVAVRVWVWLPQAVAARVRIWLPQAVVVRVRIRLAQAVVVRVLPVAAWAYQAAAKPADAAVVASAALTSMVALRCMPYRDLLSRQVPVGQVHGSDGERCGTRARNAATVISPSCSANI
jgi:hypothetical protein